MSLTIQEKRQGCYWGQCVGDALGSIVEFKTKETIAKAYPNGITELIASPVFPTAERGQLTDDSEMAIALMTSMHDSGGNFIGYDPDRALKNYRDWYDSAPIDCGFTISRGITGDPNPSSEANGALMRVSALALRSDSVDETSAVNWARQDSELTHPNPVCVQANQLFVALIRHMLVHDETFSGEQLHEAAQHLVSTYQLSSLSELVMQAKHQNVSDFYINMGWVRLALQNALFHLFNDTPWREAVHTTVIQGGDTDTNAAIVGALLGARSGAKEIPERWLHDVKSARPARRPDWLHAYTGAQLIS
ncbi:ADP-ribosylglycohydrolase family protein [Pseudidiomarina insulisalsae]|nr:ADP-ribosylglycohydrolase family protein [Pseudidiomarina insulisalsae]